MNSLGKEIRLKGGLMEEINSLSTSLDSIAKKYWPITGQIPPCQENLQSVVRLGDYSCGKTNKKLINNLQIPATHFWE